MLEPVLLGFKVLFLLLLYLFIFRVIRSAGRDLKAGAEPAAMPAAPVAGAVRAPVAPVVAPSVPVRGERRPIPADSAEADVGNTSEFDYLKSKIKPRLVVQRSKVLPDGKVFRLKGGATIGRSPRSDIALEDDYVSSTHVRVFARRQFLYLEDLGSTNGTFVDGRRVDGEVQIKPGQEIVIGDTIFRYEE
ncbi:MAG: FHA domain-containing protein [Thermoleophilia bacterium]